MPSRSASQIDLARKGSKTMTNGRSWLILASWCALGCAPAFSQSTFGSILGTAQDASGGTIAGVANEITNLDENTTRKATSNESGFYQFLNLQPGRYSLAATKSGFAASRVTDIP